jgi:hypothetical protein
MDGERTAVLAKKFRTQEIVRMLDLGIIRREDGTPAREGARATRPRNTATP